MVMIMSLHSVVSRISLASALNNCLHAGSRIKTNNTQLLIFMIIIKHEHFRVPYTKFNDFRVLSNSQSTLSEILSDF